jgi:recombination protein RecA
MPRLKKPTTVEDTKEKGPKSKAPRYGEDPVPGFFPTGSTLLDLAFGGKGYPLGRIVNIVGDFSSGKTNIGLEACINFKRTFPKGKIRYIDAESAVSRDYAEELGLMRGDFELSQSDDGSSEVTSVRETIQDLLKFLSEGDSETEKLYVLDSLDALVDDLLSDEDSTSGYAGARKAAAFNVLLNRATPHLQKKKCLFLVISQIRVNIGVMFGPKFRRSGGKALDFYSSIICWMTESEKIVETTPTKLKIQTGIRTKAQIKKNKVGKPGKEVHLNLLFGYGIDDELSCLEWLKDAVGVEKITIGEKEYKITSLKNYIKKARKENKVAVLNKLQKSIRDITIRYWQDMEDTVRIGTRKYREEVEEMEETPTEEEDEVVED